MESHHICPKDKNLFPEYTKIKEHPWNNANLTARQHYDAHHMLWKAYGKGMTKAFLGMSGSLKRYGRTHPKIYESVRDQYFLENSGDNHWMKGIPKSDKWRESNAKVMKGKNNPMFGLKGELSPNYGRTNNEEQLAKMRKPKSNTENFKKPKTETWKLARRNRTGNKSPNYDHTIREWYHLEHGTFIGTNWELAKKFPRAPNIPGDAVRVNRIKGWKFIKEMSSSINE